MKIADLLAQRRELMDCKSEHEWQAKKTSKLIEEVDRQIIKYHEETGLDKFSGGGLSASIKIKETPTYDPDRWHEVIEWISKNKQYSLIQRRLNTRPIVDLIDSGGGLPPGVGLNTEPKVQATRSK